MLFISPATYPMVTETVAIAKRVFSGSIPQLRSDRVSLCLPGNGATSCQPGATRQEASADALSSVQSAPYETTGTVAVQPSPVESVDALEAAANTVANLDSQVGLPSKARFWPVSDGLASTVAMHGQTSVCSAISRASSTSIPRYRTVLSSFVWPSNS